MGDLYARDRALEMRAAEDNSGKVLQRLIQEQLRYGGVTDNRGLLAIQHQASTAGSPGSATGAGASHGASSLAPASLGATSLGGTPAATAGSSVSSTESSVQDLRQSARQEPQGQEHQSSETPEKQAQRLALLQQQALQQQQYHHQQQQYQQHHTTTEELPSYEEAKVHSQYYSSLQSQGQGQTVHQARMSNTGPAAFYVTATVGAQKGRTEGRPAVQRTSPLPIMQDDGLKELKQGHVRSLSERLMQLTLENNGAKAQLAPGGALQQPSADFCRLQNQSPPQRPYDPRGPPPEYPFKQKAAFALQGSPLHLNQLAVAQRQQHHVPGAAEQHLLRYQPPPEYNMARQTQHGMQVMQMQYHSPSASQGSAGSMSMQMPGAGGFPGPAQNLGSMTLTTAAAQHTPMYAGLGGQLAMAHTAGPGEELHFMLLRSQQTVELLTEENQLLRSEVESYCEKDVKLQKMEREVLRISEAYESLEKSTSKRETLEKAMRTKMESEIRRLHDFNRDLRDRLETSNKQLASREYENSEDNKLTIAKLIAQNKETLVTKEKLEVELAGLRSTNGDQRRHLELLNQAFSSSEAKAVKLQEELKKKQFYVDKVEKLQQALSQLQVACDKREQLERRLRTRLERELETLRAQQRQGAPPAGASSEHAAPALMELLREKEERVLALEADMMRWEQKYLEESAMRQFAMDAAATAATERDTTIIANSPNASFSEEEEFMLASRRCHDMEGRIKNLHAQIIEKDAMIKVLQQRSRKEQQGKTESPASSLRPAKSVPSIAAAAASPGGGPAGVLAARRPPVSASPSLEERLGARTGSFSGLVSAEPAEEGCTAPTGLSPMRALSPLPPPPPHFTHVKSGSKDSSTQTERGAQEGGGCGAHADPTAAERKKSNTLPRGSKMLPSLHVLRADARDRADMNMSAGERPPLPLSGLLQEDQVDNDMVEILI